MLVQNGTLRVGDVIVCGQAHGRVKAMYDTLDDNRRVDEAGPSMPVNITGLRHGPERRQPFLRAGRHRQGPRNRPTTVPSRNARSTLGAVGFQHVTLENLFDRLDHTGEVQTLNIILRADVRGSIEAIEKELAKLEHPEVKIKLLQKSVGGITEADVTLAHASDAIIIGFNVVPDEKARVLAEKTGVQIRRYDVIYKITDDLKLALEGMLKPEEREVELGRVLVQQVFKISRVGTVAGCRVLSGRRRAQQPGPRHSRQHDHRRLRARHAPARKGRRQGSSRRLRVRHQAGRLQRRQGRRLVRGLQGRRNPTEV